MVKVSDSENNLAQRTMIFTVKLPPAPVPIKNIMGESLKVENIQAGQQVKFNFTAEITSVTLVPNENMREMILTIVRHENLALPPFDNTKRPYRYFEIIFCVNGMDNYQPWLTSLRIEFRVEKSWMENEGISEMGLYRLRDNSWKLMSTRFVRDDFRYKYYEAEVPSFSIFALVGIRAVTAAVPPPVQAPWGGIPLLAVGLLAVVGGIGGGIWYYKHRAPKLARIGVRRELEEGPFMREITRSLEPLIEQRVREYEENAQAQGLLSEEKPAKPKRPRKKSR